ncbi:MAG: proliferating cell nuclear antigen (pcna) [Candidatus Lokiarchaeota archaeon]|nr:proliferating cell nuclear antigen (pcna) [Candidatus Lokiarchaeota archaeon]
MDFSATLENSRILKGIIEAISFLIDETYVYVYPTGLKLSAIDSSHVAMLLAFLPKELFTDYKCSQDSKIGINVQDFIKILRRAKANDEIQLQLDKKDENTLLITMKSEKSTRTFKLKSKEIPGYDAKEEGLLERFEETLKDQFSATIQMEGAVLDEIVKDALIISDLLKIQVQSAEKVINFTASDESGEVDIEIDLEGKGVLDKKVVNDAEGLYSLNFLENIIKIQAITNNFEIALGNNIPMKIKGAITSSAGNPTEGKIVYLLAPRVEDQNDDEFGDDIEAGDVEEELGSSGDDEDPGSDDEQ